eukprot:CAMPEP_0182446506 /NCGR_PEP_ID=MMETSP1172-20130603/4250_1 /TAXON_ID=708627 /ORGANISM="Timspurckia oligopyrenoides, Strain CCMP3278" /LENGTH=323 /DNA_ID=CAMNT_0024642449 /DNA_START=14 /DNA_END=985 /DNA_ORIENTATION=+
MWYQLTFIPIIHVSPIHQNLSLNSSPNLIKSNAQAQSVHSLFSMNLGDSITQQQHRIVRFRPCIDIHSGKVKQIVGSTLSDNSTIQLETNFESEFQPEFYSNLYKKHDLHGGHVIMLEKSMETVNAAKNALNAYPNGMHIGGGINDENAMEFLDAGASHVIVTSFVFRDGMLDRNRLELMMNTVGKSRLVIDLSCKQIETGGRYFVCTNRWQTMSQFEINQENLQFLSTFCDEFLVHAVDVEGKKAGMDQTLIQLLAHTSPIPVTYAGGATSIADFDLIKSLGKNKVDLTVGSALDIFGGSLSFDDAVQWQRTQLHQTSQQHQ